MLIERVWTMPPVLSACGLATQEAWKWNIWTRSSAVSNPGSLSCDEQLSALSVILEQGFSTLQGEGSLSDFQVCFCLHPGFRI